MLYLAITGFNCRYIKKYYRVDYTFAQTLRSLFTIHNETGSVWTHLIGVIIYTHWVLKTEDQQPCTPGRSYTSLL